MAKLIDEDSSSLPHFTYPVTLRDVGVPQMIHNQLLPFFSLFHCPLGLGELQTCPFPDVVFPPLPLSTWSSSPLSTYLARWFWTDMINEIHVHITAVWVSLGWSGGLRVVRLLAGSWHGLPLW